MLNDLLKSQSERRVSSLTQHADWAIQLAPIEFDTVLVAGVPAAAGTVLEPVQTTRTALGAVQPVHPATGHDAVDREIRRSIPSLQPFRTRGRAVLP